MLSAQRYSNPKESSTKLICSINKNMCYTCRVLNDLIQQKLILFGESSSYLVEPDLIWTKKKKTEDYQFTLFDFFRYA
jgi:hypothetical protein